MAQSRDTSAQHGEDGSLLQCSVTARGCRDVAICHHGGRRGNTLPGPAPQQTLGCPWLLSVALATAVTAAVGVLVGLPALRMTGLDSLIETHVDEGEALEAFRV